MWSNQEGRLVRTFEFRDFREAMAFVNEVARVAEERNHHPDIEISWNRVTLRLWTHTAGGVTDADRDLAAAVDALDRSP